MECIGSNRRTVFVGQAVAIKGTAMTQTFAKIDRKQIIEFPVAEEMQMGFCTGLALEGFKPVCVYPRWNFLLCASNQIVNHLDKLPIMSDGSYVPKVIIRTSIGSVRPLYPGPQHIGDFTRAFKSLCETINIVNLEEPEDILPAYRDAFCSDRSTILVEHADYINEK
jgi:pyruvate/2-oxoglutarate/acetoin dehydrogenase E1 component